MTTQAFIDSLSAEQQAALTAYRDEIVAAHTLSLETLRDSLQGNLDDKDARIEQLQGDATTALTDHETALQDAEQKRLDDLAALRTTHEAQLAEIQGQPAPSVQATIQSLSDAFKTQIPAAFQSDPELLKIFATVNVLLNAGEPAMASTFIQNAVVPAELEPLKPAFVALINPA